MTIKGRDLPDIYAHDKVRFVLLPNSKVLTVDSYCKHTQNMCNGTVTIYLKLAEDKNEHEEEGAVTLRGGKMTEELGDYERLEKMLRDISNWVTDALITLPEIEGPGFEDAYRDIAYDCSRIATRADLVLIEIDKQRKGYDGTEKQGRSGHDVWNSGRSAADDRRHGHDVAGTGS